MHFLTDIAISILTTYLAFTNTLTSQITQILPATSSEVATAQTTDNRAPTGIKKLSSAYQAIPQILIEDSTYQSASVIDSTTEISSTYSPIEALVNIYCTYTTDEYVRSTTGTGYFIHQDGIILTNAHVAQFLLLEGIEGSTECIIRVGNPATASFEADLLYISPAWVQKHADQINKERPQGTGERDYALLYVTSGIDNNPMPRYFPALTFDTELIRIGSIRDTVFAAGYPAETAFALNDAHALLLPKQATTSIEELMTFTSNYADIFTIAGSDIGEQGSSGGPIVNEKGDAIGLISTRGDDAQFGQGSLRAITLSYIDRTIKEETGFTLRQNLEGNLPFRAKIFRETLVPFLRAMLERELGTQ